MSKRLRVLSLSTMFPRPGKPGNFGAFVERQYRALVEAGEVDLTVINPVPAAPWPLSRWLHSAAERALPRSDASRGYPVHHPRYTYVPRLGGRWNPPLISRAVLPLAHALHHDAPFDLVDAQFYYPDGPAAAVIARALDLPLSIKARGSDISFWGQVPYASRAILAAAAQAGGSLAVSAALKQEMFELGMAPDKLHVHYTGLDHAVFHPRDRQVARAELAAFAAGAAPAEGRLLVSTGNLIPLKGQALVIAALRDLPDTRLVIAGKGPDESALREQAAQAGLADRVHFAVYPPDTLAIVLAAADAMVLPSEREGLANAWIEALACGTPLVITDVGGAREVVTSPAAGRLVERNPEAIAAAVRELLASPPDPDEVGAAAARFSWEANAALLAEHYRRISGI